MMSEEKTRIVDYDVLVDWDKRLNREAPFFRELFDRVGVETVADVGCNNGHHDIMFAGWGVKVHGIDPDAEAIDEARERTDEAGLDIEFSVGGFGDVARVLGGPYDSVVCIGNVLPHVAKGGLDAAIADMVAVLRPGGVMVLHLLNHDRMRSQEVRMVQPVFREPENGDYVFLRIIGHEPEEFTFEFVTLIREPGAESWETLSRKSRHTYLPLSKIKGALERTGLVDVSVFGNHKGASLDPENDESPVITAIKGTE